MQVLTTGVIAVLISASSAAAVLQIKLPLRTTAKATVVVDENAQVLMGGKAARMKSASASEKVTVTATESSPACSGGGRKFDIRQGIDGSTGMFVIPSGKVFVMTAFDWFETGAAASLSNIAQIVVVSPSAEVTLPLTSSAILDANGAGGGQTTIPSGFPVRSGAVTCLVSTNPGAADRGFLHGYFADDE